MQVAQPSTTPPTAEQQAEAVADALWGRGDERKGDAIGALGLLRAACAELHHALGHPGVSLDVAMASAAARGKAALALLEKR